MEQSGTTLAAAGNRSCFCEIPSHSQLRSSMVQLDLSLFLHSCHTTPNPQQVRCESGAGRKLTRCDCELSHRPTDPTDQTDSPLRSHFLMSKPTQFTSTLSSFTHDRIRNPMHRVALYASAAHELAVTRPVPAVYCGRHICKRRAFCRDVHRSTEAYVYSRN